MSHLSNIFQLGIKELRTLGRDKAMLFLIIYCFTMAVYSSATAVPDIPHRATIAVVDEDQSAASKRIIDGFLLPYFLPPVMTNQAGIDSGMDLGHYTFALDIPPDFQRDLLRGETPIVQLNVDATQVSQAYTGAGYVQQIITREVNDFLARNNVDVSQPVQTVTRLLYNPNATQAWFGSVNELINDVTMLSIVLTGAALIREREHGTIEHLLVMPVTPFEIMASKVASMGIVVLVATAFSLIVVVRGWLNVPTQGSIILFLMGAALHLFATTSMGIFFGTVARSMPQLGLLIILVLLPLQLLSGGTTPREGMPEAVQDIMLLAPTTHFVMLGQGVLFRGAGFSIVWPQFLALAVIGLAFFMFALYRLRKSLD